MFYKITFILCNTSELNIIYFLTLGTSSRQKLLTTTLIEKSNKLNEMFLHSLLAFFSVFRVIFSYLRIRQNRVRKLFQIVEVNIKVAERTAVRWPSQNRS